MPKFADTIAWQQADLLMQPVFIRVIDNIGKQLEASGWTGTYEDTPVWPEGVPEETRVLVMQLHEQLAIATPEQVEEIEEALARLPQPAPGYVLRLERAGAGKAEKPKKSEQKPDQSDRPDSSSEPRQITIDIWQLCYQICFRNYSPVLSAMDSNFVVEIDTSLIDENNDVDWRRLDNKAKQLIEQIFSSLPV